jgi:hypothetical protein
MGESYTNIKIVVGKTEWKASLRDLGVEGRMIWGIVLHMVYITVQRDVSEDVKIKMAVRISNFA